MCYHATDTILIEDVATDAIISYGCMGGVNNVLQFYVYQKRTETSLNNYKDFKKNLGDIGMAQ